MRVAFASRLRLVLVLLLAVSGPALGEKMTGDKLFDAFRQDERGFIRAVAEGHLGDALAQAARLPGGVNVTGTGAETALLVAVSGLDRAMVSGLLKAGANPDGGTANAPLAVAVRAKDLTVAKLLLAGGANPDGRGGSRTALHEAALMGAQHAIELLLSSGANINATDAVGGTPVLMAAGADHWAAVDLLLDHGASVWAHSTSGLTLGLYAATSRLLPTSDEGKALALVVNKLKGKRFPWPPPMPEAVREAVANNTWPQK